jgi:hypothetical protein
MPSDPNETGAATDTVILQIKEILNLVPGDAGESAKHDVFRRLLPLLVKLNPAARDLIIRTIKARLGIGLGAIRAEVARLGGQKDRPPTQHAPPREPSRESRALLEDPELLNRFLEDTTSLGLIGEEPSKITLLLGMTSRLSPQPMNIVVKGESAAGKNYLVATISRLFPPAQVVDISNLSPQSLSYWEGDLVHKILIITEVEGAERAEYTLRILQSEGQLTVHYVTKVDGQLKTVEKKVQGPAATITTTTRESLHPENETRLVEISLDESEAQTARIIAFQAKRRAHGVDPSGHGAILELWRGAMAALEILPVITPFAELIRFPTKQVRARRDFQKFLNLIEVSAFLHQGQRERQDLRGSVHIIADIRDYALAYDLIHVFVARVQEGLNDREVKVIELLKRRSPEHLSARDVADSLGWYEDAGRKRASRCLEGLREKQRVDSTDSLPGVTTLYWFRAPPPSADPRISTPEEVARAISDQGGRLPTTWTSPLSRPKAKE